MMKGRTPTKLEVKWMRAIADFGCVVCYNQGFFDVPAAIHHIDGKTKKAVILKRYHYALTITSMAVMVLRYMLAVKLGRKNLGRSRSYYCKCELCCVGIK